jgi:hypothetical protein
MASWVVAAKVLSAVSIPIPHCLASLVASTLVFHDVEWAE